MGQIFVDQETEKEKKEKQRKEKEREKEKGKDKPKARPKGDAPEGNSQAKDTKVRKEEDSDDDIEKEKEKDKLAFLAAIKGLREKDKKALQLQSVVFEATTGLFAAAFKVEKKKTQPQAQNMQGLEGQEMLNALRAQAGVEEEAEAQLQPRRPQGQQRER